MGTPKNILKENYKDTGTILSQRGRRKSKVDTSVPKGAGPNGSYLNHPHLAGENNDDIDRIMMILNMNLQHRIKNRKTNRGKIKGLFGGGQ